MFKVIVKIGNEIKGEYKFETQEEISPWLDKYNDFGTWGKPAGWYYGNALTDEEKALATDVQTVDQNGLEIPGGLYLMPKQWTAEITDITEEVEKEKRIQKYLARMDFGKRLMADLADENLQRLIAGETTVEALVSAEAKLEVVQRLLLNGSTSLALGAIQQISPILTEYPDSLKISLIAKVQGYLAQET